MEGWLGGGEGAGVSEFFIFFLTMNADLFFFFAGGRGGGGGG